MFTAHNGSKLLHWSLALALEHRTLCVSQYVGNETKDLTQIILRFFKCLGLGIRKYKHLMPIYCTCSIYAPVYTSQYQTLCQTITLPSLLKLSIFSWLVCLIKPLQFILINVLIADECLVTPFIGTSLSCGVLTYYFPGFNVIMLGVVTVSITRELNPWSQT